ncbi:MAG: HAD-IC family P-type ATPase, partial [Acetobacteraceae bacterium]|nr:HAD-IC family P-type ATPase [Acetobacteraceae bacterium]
MELSQRLPWHALGTAETLQALGVDPGTGLRPEEAKGRLRRFGPNLLGRAKRPSAAFRFFSQFRDLTVGLLAAAALVSVLVGEAGDALVIGAIVVLNAALGFVQERRAERALEALACLSAPRARVLRGGRLEEVEAEGLVPGDVLLLEPGDRIAADARLLETWALEVEEAGLTGESVPVPKSAAAVLAAATPLADRRNLVFAGTSVASGRGKAVVVATGMATEMGRIAGLLERAGEEPTPLQRRLTGLGRALAGACLLVCGLVVAAGVWRGQPPAAMALAGVSLAVAAVPEGLPAVVTVCLALGVQRMARRRAIVRRLQAVEALGCATVLCVDKTGTITENRMTLRLVLAGGRWWEATGEAGAACFRPSPGPARQAASHPAPAQARPGGPGKVRPAPRTGRLALRGSAASVPGERPP